MIERVPSESDPVEGWDDEQRAMIRQLVEEAAQAEFGRAEGEFDNSGALLIDASSLEEDTEGTLLGVKQARLDSTDAILFCENEVPGGSARFHRSTSDRTETELTVICRLNGEVVVLNVGPDGITEDGEGADFV